MKPLLLFAFSLSLSFAYSQSYTSYFTGDTADVSPATQFGLCLMGGATEDDNAMKWFLQKSGGGDIVVLRTSGTNGYNAYLYSQLGISVNSVETILFNNATAAYDPYVLRRIATAEAIFMAGGDQSTYVQYWKHTPVDSLINYLSAVKKIPVGGTSAGMAILGWAYNSAANGSVTSAQALANPYNSLITVGQNDFLHLPCMNNTITDTHYDNPDRRGRHVVFMSRLMAANGDTVRGIACDEYTAVCVDSTGIAKVFGGAPTYDDNAYFLQVNPQLPNDPEMIMNGMPLTWDRSHAALKVYHVQGTSTGNNSFDLKTWQQGTGGDWQHWYVGNGVLYTTAGTPLPVRFTTIAAAEKNKAVQIKWTVAQQQDIKKYTVERRNQTGSFEAIDVLKVAASNSGSLHYQSIDKTPFNGNNFYRIKASQLSGEVSYSATAKVFVDAGETSISIAPNPATDHIIIKRNDATTGTYLLRLINATGIVCYQSSLTFKEGNSIQNISLPGSVVNGSYVLQLSNDNCLMVSEKIIVKR